MGAKRRLSPLAKHLEKILPYSGLSPNSTTLLSLLFAAIASYLILESNVLESLFFLFFALIFDGLDGIIARAQHKVTAFGAYLDGITDRVVEFLILASMIGLSWPDPQLALYSIITLLSFGTFLTSFAKAYADHKRAVGKNDVGRMGCILERTERSILIFISLMVYMASPLYSLYLISAGALLSIASFLQRVAFVYNHKAGA